MLYVNLLRMLIVIAMIETLVGCSSHPRTKWTDPAMRIMIDGDGLSARDYVRIVHALQSSGKWFVVDRRDGLRAIFKEQKMIHRDHPDKFKDEEKYSMWGRLYGVGAVIIGHVQCHREPGFWFGSNSSKCVQNLAIISANSGQVIATAEGTNDDAEIDREGDIRIASDWTETVGQLNDNFPQNFNPLQYDKNMLNFRAEAKEEAIRAKEELANQQ